MEGSKTGKKMIELFKIIKILEFSFTVTMLKNETNVNGLKKVANETN